MSAAVLLLCLAALSSAQTSTEGQPQPLTTGTPAVPRCGALPAPENGFVNLGSPCDGGVNGTTCEVSCAAGHLLPSDAVSVTATCRPGQTPEWQADTDLACSPLDCGTPALPEKLAVSGACATTFNSTCSLSCADGHSVDGADTTRCTDTGDWTPVGSCVDTDACLASPCAANRSICRDLPASEHVGTGNPGHECTCAEGYQGRPGTDGEGCVRRGIATRPGEGLTVNLLPKDDVTVVLRGEEGEEDVIFSLRRDIGDVLSGLDAPGGPVDSVEAALNTVLATQVEQNADALEEAKGAADTLSTSHSAAAEALDDVEENLVALSNAASAAAADDASALNAASSRVDALSSTFDSISGTHSGNTQSHSDLSSKVSEELAAELADVKSDSLDAEDALSAAINSRVGPALDALDPVQDGIGAEETRHNDAIAPTIARLECNSIYGLVWRNDKCEVALPKTVAFHVDKAGAQTGVQGWQRVENWQEYAKPSFSQNWSYNKDGEFSPAESGVYACYANVKFNGATASYVRAVIAKNGDRDVQGGTAVIRGSVSNIETLAVSGFFELTTSSKVSLEVYSHTDSTFQIGTETGMSCARIEPSLDHTEGFHADLASSRSMTTVDRTVGVWRTSGDPRLFMSTARFNEGSGVYTAPAAGLYLFQGNVRLNGANHGSDATWYRITLTVDQFNADGTSKWVDYVPSGDYHSAGLSGAYLLRRGQNVEIRVASAADGSFAVDTQSGFGALRLSDAIRRPSCMADKWADLALPAGRYAPVTTWNARVNKDHGLHCSGDFDDDSGIYTVPVSGVYYVQAHIRVAHINKGSGCSGLIKVMLEVNNQQQENNGQTSFDSNPPCYGTTEVVQGMGYYAKGDRIRVTVFGQFPVAVATSSSMSITLISTDNVEEYRDWVVGRGAVASDPTYSSYPGLYNFFEGRRG